MKQKNKFRRILQILCILCTVIVTLFVFTPVVSALDNDNSTQQEEDSEMELSKDSSIQTSSSQQNETQEKNIASGRFGSSDWKIDDSGCLHIGEGTFASVYGSMSPWGVWRDQITSIVIEGRVILDSDSAYLFYNLQNVKTISGLSKVDTSRVIYMNSMFQQMYALTELDVSTFDTSKVKEMRYMFSNMLNLKKLNLSTLDTSEVTDMTGMFQYMHEVRELNVSSFDTSKVKTFSNMFDGMTRLEKLDLRNFNTSNASNMARMFAAMNSLKKIDVSSFDTSKVTSMTSMFSGMYALTELDVSSFDTSKVINISNMFLWCPVLRQLTLGKEFGSMEDTGLPSVPISNEFTGKWINVASGTVGKPSGKNIWTSQELMKNYQGMRDADTYVWQKKRFITEYYYDTEGNPLKGPVITEVDGKIFTPKPAKYEEVNDTLYIYKGWTEEQPESGTSIHGGTPPSTTVERTYYYVYEKADKLINVTIPTEIVFGTEEHSKNITSKDYDIKNNSNDVDLQMTLATFDKVNSDIQLLDEGTTDPSGKENSARLNLLVGGKITLSGLNEKVSEQELGNIQSGKTTTLALTGTYFGDLSERHKVEYKTNLKFKAQAKVKN